MSTQTATPAATGPVGVTPVRVVRSEWTKLWSLRSTAWTLAGAVGLVVGIGTVFCAVTAHQWPATSGPARAAFDPVTASLSGVTFAQLTVGVLGVLMMTGEYGTGAVRATMTVVPSRLPVLAGKLVVFAVAVFPLMLVGVTAAFLLGQRLLGPTGAAVGLGAAGVARSVIGAALYLVVAGVIAVAVGASVRNTAAGISGFVALFFVLPPLVGLLPSTVAQDVFPYLPGAAGTALWSPTGHSLAPWPGFGLFCGYAAVAVVVAFVQLGRRDV